jgi:hypothetical protein
MLLVTKMGIGGAERVASVLLQNLDRSRFSPELTVISDVGSAYRIPDDAPAFVLDEQDLPDATIDSVSIPDDIKQRHLSTLLWLEMTAGRLATRVRQREPDVIISTPMLASVIAALACT